MEDERALDTAMLHFKAELARNGKPEREIERYISHNNAFLSFIKKRPHYVRKEDVELYIKYLASDANLPKRLVLEITGSLNLFYDDVFNRGFCIEDPYTSIAEERILSKEEIKGLIESSPSIKQKLLIKVLYSTGMKLSECVKLAINHIDFNNKKINFMRGKTDISFPLPESLIPDLGNYLKTRKDNNPYLFEDNHEGHISPRTAQTYIDLAAEHAGLGKVFYPALQKSFAKHLSEAGGIRASIYYRLYHTAKITSTEDYILKAFGFIKDKQHPLDTM